MTVAEAVDRVTADIWFATFFILGAISLALDGWQAWWVTALSAVTIVLSVLARLSANRKARSRS